MKKQLIKPRNNSTMTEAGFWSFIRSSLRRRTMVWKPIQECKKQAKRVYKGLNKRQKFEYKCNVCKNYFPDKEVNIDHIKPAGSLKSGKDLQEFIERLFCEKENLQVLCSNCHNLKSINDKLIYK